MDDVASQFNFSWIDEHMCGFAFPRTEEQVAFLAEQGVNIILSLSADSLNKQLAQTHGMEVRHMPVLDFGTPSRDLVNTVFDLISNAIEQTKKVGVHCLFGQGRTGLMLALYMIKFQRLSQKDALAEIKRLRPKSVESVQQHRYVLTFVP